MKKWILLGITLVAMLVAVAAFALPVSAGTYGNLTYTVSNGEVTITDCDEMASGVMQIPRVIEGYPVTKIGKNAFYRCYKLTKIIIPDSVTFIDDNAFLQINITSIEIPDSVTYIGEWAFEGCENLTQVVIPSSVAIIHSDTFAECTSLSNVVISNGVTTIGIWAFYYCTNLTSAVIPSSVVLIDRDAFGACDQLANITILAPSVDIYDSSSTISDTATIYGYDGSTAEAYANKYNRNFVSLGAYHTCSFNQKNTSSTYLQSSANCTSPAEYYYSCTCGEKGIATFTSGSALGHTYDNTCDTSCNTCGASRTINHTYTNACDTSCNVCGKTRSTSHAYDSGKVTKEPTTSAEGERTFTCTVCKATRTETIDKLPPVTTTKPVTTEPTPITTLETNEAETNVPVTDAPTPDTDEPTTDASTVTTAATTNRNLSDMDRPLSPDQPAPADTDSDSTLLIVIAAMGVCLVGAVAVIVVMWIKKK